MKALKIISILMFVSPLYAQEWAHIGATWYYDQISLGPVFDGTYIKYEVTRDTLIENYPAWIFRQTVTSIFSPEPDISFLIMREEAGRVFRFDVDEKDFKLLYDFSVQVHDTFEIWCFGDYSKLKVDSIGTRIINSYELKTFFVGPIEPICETGGEIIEYIGCTGFMFPQEQLLDPPFGEPLRCYQDPIIGDFKLSDKACDFINPTQDLEILDIMIYPNPAVNFLYIDDKRRIVEHVRLFNFLGGEININWCGKMKWMYQT